MAVFSHKISCIPMYSGLLGVFQPAVERKFYGKGHGKVPLYFNDERQCYQKNTAQDQNVWI